MKFIKLKDIFLFLFLLILCYCFPYTHDDWSWGSSFGLELLNNNFEDYNGRYFSNTLVLILTRYPIIKSITMALTLFLIFKLMQKIINKEKNEILSIIFILFFTLNAHILAQGLVWTSGFVNYTVCLLFISIYLFFNRNMFSNEKAKITWKSMFPLFILGFISALILENITIYCIILGIFVIIYTFIKEKKVFLSHISYLIGTILGAIIMFSNGIYHEIASGDDWYRSFNLLEDAFVNFTEIIYEEFIFSNIFLILGILILVILASSKEKLNIIQKFSVLLIGFYSFYVILYTTSFEWNVIENVEYFNSIASIVYIVSLFIFTLSFVKGESLKKMLLYLISIIIMIGIYLFVSPIGSRHFLITSYFFILFICELYNYLNVENKNYILFVLAFTVGFYILSIYSFIKYNDIERTKYINKQIKENAEVIYFPRLPYNDYTWISVPGLPKLKGEVQEFYGMKKDTKISVISYKKFKKEALEKCK